VAFIVVQYPFLFSPFDEAIWMAQYDTLDSYTRVWLTPFHYAKSLESSGDDTETPWLVEGKKKMLRVNINYRFYDTASHRFAKTTFSELW